MFASKKKSATASAAVVSDDDNIYTGYLEKRGRGRSMFGSRDYQTRFLVVNISSGFAQYFSDETSLDKPLGDFNLRGAEISPISNKDLVFSAKVNVTNRPETMEFRGISDENRNIWVEVFRKASTVKTTPSSHVEDQSDEQRVLGTEGKALSNNVSEVPEITKPLYTIEEFVEEPEIVTVTTKVPFSTSKADSSKGRANDAIVNASRSSSFSGFDENVEYLSPTVVGGEILKQGRGRTLSMIKPWKKRYVIVDMSTGDITYFEEVRVSLNSSAKPKGDINVKGGKLSFPTASIAGKEFALEIEDKSGRNHIVFACVSSAQFEEWKKIFLSACSISSPTPKTPFSADVVVPEVKHTVPEVMTLPSPTKISEEHSFEFSVKSLKYPSQSLLRRIKVWKASQGFTSPKAPFSVKALQNFFRRLSFEEGPHGDKIISALPLALLSGGENETEVGWIEVMQLLRDCERLASEESLSSVAIEPIPVTMQLIDYSISLSHPLEIDFVHTDSPMELSLKLSETLNQFQVESTKDSCLRALCLEGNPYQKIIESLYNDLVACHEIFVNLETIIASLKLNNRVTVDTTPSLENIIDESSSQMKSDDMDNKTRSDEWRTWMKEKQSLISSHNAKLEELVNENKSLRAAMNPDSEVHVAHIRRCELRRRVAEEAQMSLQEENKVLQAEVSRLRDELDQLSKSASGSWPTSYSAYSKALAGDYTGNLLDLSRSDHTAISTSFSTMPSVTTHEDVLLLSTDKGHAFRPTVLSGSYVFPKSDDPLSLTPNLTAKEFKVGSPEFNGKSSLSNKSSAKQSHPLRAALRDMMIKEKGLSTSNAVPLSKLVSISTDQIKKEKVNNSANQQGFMMPTDSSVMKKKDVSQAAVIAGLKTYSGWRVN